MNTKNEFEFQIKKLNCCFGREPNNTLEIAQRLSYIKNKELYKDSYKTFNEFCRKAFKNPVPRSTMSEYTNVVYKFCKEDVNSNTGYCVKSLFKNYSYSHLRKMIRLTEDEISLLGLDPDMSVRELSKVVNDYKKTLMGTGIIKKEEIEPKNNSSYEEFNLERYSFKFFDCDKCLIGRYKKPVTLNKGLTNLKEQIIKDIDNDYYVVKVPKTKPLT